MSRRAKLPSFPHKIVLVEWGDIIEENDGEDMDKVWDTELDYNVGFLVHDGPRELQVPSRVALNATRKYNTYRIPRGAICRVWELTIKRGSCREFVVDVKEKKK